jgi:hypothetical protein
MLGFANILEKKVFIIFLFFYMEEWKGKGFGV